MWRYTLHLRELHFYNLFEQWKTKGVPFYLSRLFNLNFFIVFTVPKQYLWQLLDLVPVPGHLVFFIHSYSFPFVAWSCTTFNHNTFVPLLTCLLFFFQGTQISILWYRVSFWRTLNLPPRVPFAKCLAQSSSLKSVITSESIALHFISNHRNTLFPCSSFWWAPFSIKSSWSFLETTEKFHANMQKDSHFYTGIQTNMGNHEQNIPPRPRLIYSFTFLTTLRKTVW